MAPVLRSRRYGTGRITGTEKVYANGRFNPPTSVLNYGGETTGTQMTRSHGHQWPPSRNDKGDVGGPFVTQLATVRNNSAHVSLAETSSGIYRTYQGQIVPRSLTLTAGTFIPPSSKGVMDGLGTTGIARAIPTNPLSGMGQFLGELRQLPSPPTFKNWKEATERVKHLDVDELKSLKRGSDDYLNFMFGWMPLVKDMTDFAKTVIDAEKHISQYERDSGRNIRRRRTVHTDSNTEFIPGGTTYGVPALSTPLYNSPGKLVITKHTYRKVWFSGAFTYYLPPSGVKRRGALAAKLFGLRLTPKLVWDLAPWSWAVDWVGNVGDVVNNWSAFANDDLVMRYGYVMETITEVTVYQLTGLTLKGHGAADCDQTVIRTTKQRHIATPFGFGANPSSFSARQWSILAALGISRGHRTL